MSDSLDLVVVGLGYVGLPLASQAVRCGIRVAGFDLNDAVVEGLNAGRSHIDDLSDEDVSTMRANGFEASTDTAVLGNADAIVICVPTPLDDTGSPDLAAVKGASSGIAEQLQRGQLVVLESTTYPGTTDDIVRPMLEVSGLTAGKDFFSRIARTDRPWQRNLWGPKHSQGCRRVRQGVYRQGVRDVRKIY